MNISGRLFSRINGTQEWFIMLYNNKELFEQMVLKAVEHFSLDAGIIEKN